MAYDLDTTDQEALTTLRGVEPGICIGATGLLIIGSRRAARESSEWEPIGRGIVSKKSRTADSG